MAFRVTIRSAASSGCSIQSVIATDGKTLRRCFGRASQKSALHLVSALSAPGLRMARTLNAKERQRLRFQTPSPAEYGAQVIGSSEHRSNGYGKDRLQRKLSPFAAPPVCDRAKNIP